MSAIWGVIDLSGENIKSETATDMKKTYENYKIDRFCECLNSNVLFGCAHQHITDISVLQLLMKFPTRQLQLFLKIQMSLQVLRLNSNISVNTLTVYTVHRFSDIRVLCLQPNLQH